MLGVSRRGESVQRHGEQASGADIQGSGIWRHVGQKFFFFFGCLSTPQPPSFRGNHLCEYLLVSSTALPPTMETIEAALTPVISAGKM